MLKRLVLAVVEGAVPGGLIGVAMSRLGVDFSGVAAYGAAAAMGVLTGLWAGKPIWARDAKTEALIKALAGAFICTVTLFGVRKWLGGITVDLTAAGDGKGPLGDFGIVALPSIGVAYAIVLEIDDAFGPDAGPAPVRVDAATADTEAGSTDAGDAASADARRAHRG